MFHLLKYFTNIFEIVKRILIHCNNAISVNNYNEIAYKFHVFFTIFRRKTTHFRRNMLQKLHKYFSCVCGILNCFLISNTAE